MYINLNRKENKSMENRLIKEFVFNALLTNESLKILEKEEKILVTRPVIISRE